MNEYDALRIALCASIVAIIRLSRERSSRNASRQGEIFEIRPNRVYSLGRLAGRSFRRFALKCRSDR